LEARHPAHAEFINQADGLPSYWAKVSLPRADFHLWTRVTPMGTALVMDETLETLIIDDSPTDAQTLSYLLRKRLRCQVVTASDGVEGLERLSSRRFDLVFLDLVMPQLNGIEVLKKIRSSADNAELPVVVISSHSEQETVCHLLQLKVFDYLIKPYNAEALVKRLGMKMNALRTRKSLTKEP